MTRIRYSDDKALIIFNDGYGEYDPSRDVAVPVALLEFFMDAGVRPYHYEDLVGYHALGRQGATSTGEPMDPEIYCVKDLVGVDLTGASINFFLL